MATVEELTERILYRLSLDPRARELAARLLERFHRLVGDLPASADYHHKGGGGLYQHSLEVALKMLEEFEGNIIMERRADGSVDSFKSAHNRPRWQYATFLTALCHDLGKLFDMEVCSGRQRWFPLHTSYQDFARKVRKPPSIAWREEREHGAHAALSNLLMHHLLTVEDLDYLGLDRFVQLAGSLAESHSSSQDNPIARMVSKLDQASVEEAQVALVGGENSKISYFLYALGELIKSGKIGVNFPGAQVYAMAEKTAVVVPLSLGLARDYLRGRNVVLPPNTHLYNMLRNADLVEADTAGHSVRKVRVPGKQGSVVLSALVLATQKIVPKEVLPTLPPIQFEIEPEPQPETGEQHVG